MNAVKYIYSNGWLRAVVEYYDSVSCGVCRKGVQAPLCVQDVTSRITRGVVVCVQNYH